MKVWPEPVIRFLAEVGSADTLKDGPGRRWVTPEESPGSAGDDAG